MLSFKMVFFLLTEGNILDPCFEIRK